MLKNKKITEFLDFLGNKLIVGDEVVMVAPKYRHYCKGTIIAFTAKNVRIEYLNTWNYCSDGHKKEILQSSEQLIKVYKNG